MRNNINSNRTVKSAVIFLAVIMSDLGVAQSPASFFPYHLGDVWQYRYEAFGALAWTERLDSIFADTSNIVFVRYNRFYHDGNFTQVGWYAIDDSNLVFEDLVPRQPDSLVSRLIYKLNAQVGDVWIVRYEGGPPWAQIARLVAVDTVQIFGRRVTSLEIEYGITELGTLDTNWWSTRRLGDSIGLTNAQLEPMGPVYLSGAIIDSVQWGFIVGVSEPTETPNRFLLEQNYPNPFNPSTTINFTIAHSTWITLVVYDVLGRQVQTLVDRAFEAGSHSVVWNALQYSSGVYVYRLQTHESTATRKMLLQK